MATQRVTMFAYVAEQRYGASDRFSLLVEDARQQLGGVIRFREAVEREALPGLLGVVDQIVDHNRKRANVVSVERRDEGAVEGAEDAMRDLVAAMFEIL